MVNDNGPVTPYDPAGYPTTEGAGGGTRRRLKASPAPYTPISKGTKAPKPSRSPQPCTARAPRGAGTRAANPGGGHSAAKTSGASQASSHASRATVTIGHTRMPEQLAQIYYSQVGVLATPATGPILAFGFGQMFPLAPPSGQNPQLGHHPRADGKATQPSTRHQAVHRRGQIISYNSATNTALVRLGDTPDSPTVSIPVSPMISAAVIGGATMAGITLWTDSDPNDALITAVL